MTELLQDRIRQAIDGYRAELNLHESNKKRLADSRDHAKSRARNEVLREENRIVSLQQAAQEQRQRIQQEMDQKLQQRVLRARQEMATKLSAVTTRKHDLEILRKKLPTEFASVTPAPLESVRIPDSDNAYLDLLNIMYAYEQASLLRRPDMKIKATKAAATFHAMMQAELLNIEKAERAAKEDLDLPALQREYEFELEQALAGIEMHESEIADRSKLAEVERQAERDYAEQLAAEEARHAVQPSFEAVRNDCLALIADELDSLQIGAARLAQPYEPTDAPRFESVLLNVVIDPDDFQLELPYMSSWDSPEHLWLYVDDEDVQETVLEGFRSYICENLRLLPYGQLRVYWMDPSQQGMTVRELAMLTDNLPACGPVVQRATTSAQVNALLGEIEELQAEIGEKVAPYRGGIREYNEANPHDPIPYTIIVVNDITHPGYDSRAIGLLNQRMRNASRMGMQVLALSDAYEIGSREDEALDALRDTYFRTIAEVQGGELFTQQADGQLANVRMLGPAYSEPAFIQSYVDACQEIAKRPAPKAEDEPVADLDEAPAYPASEGIEIPIGFYADGSVASIRFGSVVGGPYAEHTHGIITGGTGSGKTTFVRNLIQSACSHYSPEELELWLVDYKAEMTAFCNDRSRFPHLGLIGLDRSMDFVAGFMAYLTKENERRMKLISEPAARNEIKRTDISDYNEWARANGRETLPRLLVIVDEFHVQANAMKMEPAWRTEFEGLLREVRSRGINILLVDQDISGLSAGLTDSGQAQLSFRATLGINAGRTGDLRTLFGQASNFEETASMAASMKHQALLFDKASNSVKRVVQLRDCDWDSIAAANARTRERWPGQEHDAKIYNVCDMEARPLDEIVPSDAGRYPVGTIPDFENPLFELQLRNRNRQNVFAMGTSEALLPFNIVSLMAYTAWKYHGYRVVVLGTEDCDLFDETYDAWYELKEDYMDDQLEIYEDVPGINRFFDYEDSIQHAFVVIVGFDDLYAEMTDLSPRADVASSEPATPARRKVDDLIQSANALAAYFAGEAPAPDPEDQATSEASRDAHEEVNDMKAIYRLLTESKERDIHVAVLEDSLPPFERIFRNERRKDFEKLFPFAFATRPAVLNEPFTGAMKMQARAMEDEEVNDKIIYSDSSNRARSIAVNDVPWNTSLKG